ncbi:MAG: carbonic anhydrase [Pseudonocardiales bacterium]|jgi:carbonic anhydrase|nr:carbonic anhydrase [Pseudonocardiales bacterium]
MRTSRRSAIRNLAMGAGLAFAGGALSACASGLPSGQPDGGSAAKDPLDLLKEGNERFSSGRMQHPNQDANRLKEVSLSQDPIATVFCCIDSRITPTIVFDRGLGDLFEVRTGGQDYDSLIEGSVEYGPATSKTPLIVVMGHQRCGAVTAAVSSLEDRKSLAANLDKIVMSISPAYGDAKAVNPHANRQDLIEATTRRQIQLTVTALHADPLLGKNVGAGTLKIVGSYISLDSGIVEWL